MTPPLDPRAIFQALAEAGVRYVVIGVWAVNAHGYVRATKDVDLCPAPDPANLDRLAALLRSLGARQLGLGDFEERELPGDPTDPRSLAEGGNFRIETSLGIVDVMQWVSSLDGDLGYPELASDGVTSAPWGIPVTVCSLERLLSMKRAAGRDRDRDDVAHLTAGG